MRRWRRWIGLLGAFLFAVVAARAEVEKVELYLFGGITNRSKTQIKRVLAPYVDEEDITFRPYIRPNGKKHPWVTIVEIQPKGWYLDFYDVLHRVKDTRGVRDGRVLYRTEVVATGDLRAHFGFTRRSFGWIPGWVQARGIVTSGLWHHLRARGSGEAFVFHPNVEYDRLRLTSPRGRDVRIRGTIAGFDGPYPVVVLGSFEPIEPEGERTETEVTPEPEIPQRVHPQLPPTREKRPNRAE